MKIVLRPNSLHIDREKFLFLQERILLTTYKQWANNIDAPYYTDCITAVRYLFQHSSNFLLPTAYIWDLPSLLIKNAVCSVESLSNAQFWDLIFFEKMSKTHKKYMVTHVWIMVNNTHFIHSSLLYNGSISGVDDKEYMHNILWESFVSVAHDPRTYG